MLELLKEWSPGSDQVRGMGYTFVCLLFINHIIMSCCITIPYSGCREVSLGHQWRPVAACGSRAVAVVLPSDARRGGRARQPAAARVCARPRGRSRGGGCRSAAAAAAGSALRSGTGAVCFRKEGSLCLYGVLARPMFYRHRKVHSCSSFGRRGGRRCAVAAAAAESGLCARTGAARVCVCSKEEVGLCLHSV